VPVRSAYHFANSVGRLVERRNDKSSIAQAQPGISIPDTLPLQEVALDKQRPRVDHNMPRKVRSDSRDERPGPKLSKCMVTPVGCNDVMTRLGAAVISYDDTGLKMTDKEIGQQAFSGVPETEIYNDVCTQEQNAPGFRISVALFR
jgi:hypothetical protein